MPGGCIGVHGGNMLTPNGCIVGAGMSAGGMPGMGSAYMAGACMGGGMQAASMGGGAPGGMMGFAGAGGAGAGLAALKPGDWICPSCQDHQFAKNDACRKCGQPRPEGAGFAYGASQPAAAMAGAGGGAMLGMAGGCGGMKAGDWLCPGCGDHQFARNAACRKCGMPKPEDARGRSR